MIHVRNMEDTALTDVVKGIRLVKKHPAGKKIVITVSRGLEAFWHLQT